MSIPRETGIRHRTSSRASNQPSLLLYDLSHLWDSDLALLWTKHKPTAIIAIVVWAIILGISVFLKRRSARPGGWLYKYNRSSIAKILSARKRRLRDMLNDPLLAQDLERRLEITLGSQDNAKAEIESLRQSVAQWEKDQVGEVTKDECVRYNKQVLVPWIDKMNLIFPLPTVIFLYQDFSILTLMYASFAIVHLVDNSIIYRSTVKGFGKKVNQEQIAAVGIPVADGASVV